jgi:protein-S-isoprenylcysteine O-methyltransferase Ste14
VASLLFWIVSGAVLLNGATVVLSIVRPDLRVWPPPRRDSWQFVYNGVLSYTGLLGVVALGLVDRDSLACHHWTRLLIGALLMGCGGFALWAYLTLGAHASSGLGSELVTTGPYRYSRNPQYVGTIPTVLGWAILCDSVLALVAALLVSAWFVLVPLAEEPWCREHLGAAYEAYAARVPRFFGLRA